MGQKLVKCAVPMGAVSVTGVPTGVTLGHTVPAQSDSALRSGSRFALRAEEPTSRPLVALRSGCFGAKCPPQRLDGSGLLGRVVTEELDRRSSVWVDGLHEWSVWVQVYRPLLGSSFVDEVRLHKEKI